MFLKLTKNDDKQVYINTNEIRKFEKCDHAPEYTVLDLRYGTCLVKQRPEEIMEMLKGSD